MNLTRLRKVLDAFVFNRHVTVKKAANLALIFFQHQFLKNDKVRGYPVRLILEPTNVCNLGCPLCPASRDNKDHERGMMKLEDFTALIDEVGDYLFEVDLYDFGESFLNPRIYEMIEYAGRRNIRTNISSNLNVGDPEKIVKSGLSRLIVSIDGASQESYARYRVHGELPVVLAKIRAVNEAKRAAGTRSPELVWRFIPMRQNEHELPRVRELARELGMRLDVLPMRLNTAIEREAGQDNERVKAEWLPSLGEFKRRAFQEPVRPVPGAPKSCLFLWAQAAVNWEGSVTPCCAISDYKTYAFGHLRHDGGFLGAWNTDVYQRARRMVRRLDPKLETERKFDMCVGCIHNGFVDL